MPRENIEFKARDGVVLRGWFYTPESATTNSQPLPCIVMSHGYSAVKEMGLDKYASYFVEKLPVSCLIYDHRGFGASDTADGQPRQEIVPTQQTDDMSDAITYVQSRKDVNSQKIALWGTSYSGGHVLFVAAVDRRVKAVLSQLAFISGSRAFARNPPEILAMLNDMFIQDSKARAEGKPPVVIPSVSADESALCVMPTPDAWKYFSEWEKKSPFKNEVTLRSLELASRSEPYDVVHRIAPTPLLMTVGSADVVNTTQFALDAFEKAGEPKELHLLEDCGHFDPYEGEMFKKNIEKQVDFLKRMFLA